jgi:hypothetical protein
MRAKLESCGQEHPLTFRNDLDAGARGRLLEQIRDLDLEQIPIWVEEPVRKEPEAPLQRRDFRPARSYSPEPQDERSDASTSRQ